MDNGALAKTVNTSGPQANAPIVANWIGTYIGYGICRYIPVLSTGGFAVSGSAQTISFQIPKPHRILRFSATQFASGTPDNTGLAINLAKADNYYGGQFDILLATSGSLPDATITFQFDSGGWPVEPTVYTSTYTGQSSDVLTVEFYVQYLIEG